MKLRPSASFLFSALFALSLSFSPVSAQDAGQVLANLKTELLASQKLSEPAKIFVVEKLLPQSSNPVFCKETVAQNAKGTSLEEIKTIDAEWIATKDGSLAIQKEKMSNPCAKEIVSIVTANPSVAETFVMDNQGANVGQNQLTSDYWQGDEPKWVKSFNDGKGGVDIGEAKLDKSSGSVLQQVSLPIVAEDGKVIGSITWGIDVSKF